jgi:GT2 family glycosyltransferase
VQRPIDVIVPAYRGLAETRACVESVLFARNRGPFHLVVIDDAGPEPELREWLRARAADGAFELLVNPHNVGFVATVNRGMALHPERDVVLLNSDTEVANDWLDRLRAHAEADATVGSVSPFSNNATICSYPRTLQANPLPPGETTAQLDLDAAQANAGVCIEVPTTVGFCMLIRRACLDAIGDFDVERYGKGYGEEVDFCMRAARAGFRHLLAADVFVRHVGEVSFGGGGEEMRARAQATVDGLYPEFQQKLAAYIPADPSREARRRLDLARLRRLRPGLVLDQEGDAGSAGGLLRLLPFSATHAHLHWERAGEELALWPPLEESVVGPMVVALRAGHRFPALERDWLWPPSSAGFASAASREETQRRLAGFAAPRASRLIRAMRRVARIFAGSP